MRPWGSITFDKAVETSSVYITRLNDSLHKVGTQKKARFIRKKYLFRTRAKQDGQSHELSWSPLRKERAYRPRSSFNRFTPIGNRCPPVVDAKLVLSPSHTGRLVIIGDVHGCVLELAQLLKKVEFNRARDKLVFVGDLCNKGPRSQQAVQLAMAFDATVVRGNHDDAALSSYYELRKSSASIKNSNPKSQWVLGLSPQEAKFLAQMPFTVKIPSLNVLIAHAGLVPGIPTRQQRLQDVYRMRVLYPTGATPENQSTSDHLSLPIEESDDMLCDNEQGEASMPDMGDETFADASTSETASDDEASDHDEGPVASSSDSEPWASHWLGPGHVIFGHDARRGLQRYDYATGIDTGCVYGKELTACIIPLLPEGQGVKSVRHQTPTFAELQAELVSVPAKQAYTSIRGNIHIPIKDIPIKDRNQGLRPPKPEAN